MIATDELKRDARGRWPEILAAVGGIPKVFLHFDKKEGPCPKCAGDTRFRGIDESNGALFCSHCFRKDNGDGLAAIQWYRGCDFPTAVRMVAEYLRTPANGKPHATNGTPKITATYDYRDEQGELLYQVVRLEPGYEPGEKKTFRQRQPRPGGGWDWSIKGVRRVLYRLPELLAAEPDATIFLVEGEKDANSLAALGLVATCNSGGADDGNGAKWLPEFSQHFNGRHVVILPDKDEKGHRHAEHVASSLQGVAASHKVVELPGDGKDISDWLAAGHDEEELFRILETAPGWTASTVGPAASTAPPIKSRLIDYELITAAECLRRDYPQEFLVKDVVAKGEPMLIAAPSKACKTLIAADLAISLRKGGDFPGHFLRHFLVNRPVPTMMLWGESGWRGVQSNIRRIGKEAGVTDEDLEGLFVGVKLPKFGSPEHAAALDREIKRTGAQVVIIDCLYLCGVVAETAKNLFGMGDLLGSVKDVFVENDCTLILLHHTTKHIAPGRYLQLDDAAFAGIAEFAAQWILINRKTDYIDGSGHHDLLLTIGGRAGHGGRYGVIIDEGQFVEGEDRKWDVTVQTPPEMRQAELDSEGADREAKRLQQLGEDMQRVTKAMAALELKHPEGNAKTAIRDRSGVKGLRLDDAISDLLDDGAIVECEFTRKDRKTPRPGYKLNAESIVTTVTENRDGQTPVRTT